MYLKPQRFQLISPDTTALVGPILDEDAVYRFVRDVLFMQFHDDDFADLYPPDGHPAPSPVLRACVLVRQALDDRTCAWTDAPHHTRTAARRRRRPRAPWA